MFGCVINIKYIKVLMIGYNDLISNIFTGLFPLNIYISGINKTKINLQLLNLNVANIF